ncbi:ASPIC and UnbV [Rubripirellula amarantea]|uniref:ASPIC and UnbV n=1 Tax=Rubripirellula amarantea TaxID=2527999 RepID=A0A5C5WRS8_9BACT|nr:FG-GAP-like repeat-containing protein [Rubripirellula amarantea]TWT52763.1 ASPIC and UnbV [Rubripirellula amarantea]
MKREDQPHRVGLSLAMCVVMLSLQIGCGSDHQSSAPRPDLASRTNDVLHLNSKLSEQAEAIQTKASGKVASNHFNRSTTLAVAHDAIAREQWDIAKASLLKLLSVDHSDAEAMFAMATVASASGNQELAVELLDQIPSSHASLGVRAVGAAADLCEQSNRYDDALNRYVKLIKLVPNSSLAHRRLANLYNRLGRRHEAARHLRVLCKLGDVRQEELHSLMVLSDSGTDQPVGESGHARQFFSNLAYIQAISKLAPLYETASVPPAVDAFYGRCLAEGQQDEQFLRWLANADPPTRDFAESWAAIGAWLTNEQRFDEAVVALAQAIKRDPTDVRSYRRMVQALHALQRNEDAKRWEDQLITLRAVTIASNELGTSHPTDAQRYASVWEGLNKLGRPLESLLWKAMAANQNSSTTINLSVLNKQRIELVKTRRAFPDISTRLCNLDLEGFPTLDLSRHLEPASSASDPHRRITPTPGTPPENPQFENVAEQVGLNHAYQVASQVQDKEYMIYQAIGGGVAVIDYDLDGFVDLYFAQGGADPPTFLGSQTNELYRHVDHRLVDVTTCSTTAEFRYSVGVTAGDWNQDGFADLAVSNLGANTLLINNGDGTFRSEQTDDMDDATLMSTSIAIADITGDHLPDIYEQNYAHDPSIDARPKVDAKGELQIVAPADYQPAMDRLLANDGLGRRSVSNLSEQNENRSTGLCLLVADFDGEPGNEIYSGNDVRPNQLWKRNDKDGWQDIGPLLGISLGCDGTRTASMGIAAADYDQSGAFDFYITNFERSPSRFYVNRGGTFQDRSIAWRLTDDSFPVLGFGTQPIDYNNDGKPDVVVTNGHVENMPLKESPYRQPAQLFVNCGDHFQLQTVADSSGYFGGLHVGRSLARLDFDRNGQTDFVVTHMGEKSALLINQTETNHHWLDVQLVGVTCERDAIGARVSVQTGDRISTNWMFGGNGYLCRNEPVVPFGLGMNDHVDQLTIDWPDGTSQTLTNLPADCRMTVVQGQDEAFEM